MKKAKILKLSPDFWYLQKLALNPCQGKKNRRIVACTAIKKIACVLIAPKLWPSEIAKRYWLKSNYVSIAQATIKADSCRSGGCHNCQRKRHISICDQSRPNSGRFMTAQNKGLEQVIYPVVVNVLKCCALLDNGGGQFIYFVCYLGSSWNPTNLRGI